MLVEKNTYVRLRKHVLLSENRSDSVPEDTKKVPLKMWIKGRLVEEAELFEEATIITATGRKVTATLKEVEPKPKHTYGEYVEEIMQMRENILNEMWGEEDAE